MTPLPVETDLRAALSVEPSGSFAAGVRARIAAAPEADVVRRFGFRFWMPAAVVALAAIALAVVLRPAHAPAAGPESRLLAARSTISTATLPSIASPLVRQEPARVVAAERRTREPEILISASESRALLKLIAGPRTWRLDPSPLSRVPAPPPVTDVVIEPIVIAPLSIDGGQGVRQ